MKKWLPIVIIVAIAGVVWFVASSKQDSTNPQQTVAVSGTPNAAPTNSGSPDDPLTSPPPIDQSTNKIIGDTQNADGEADEEIEEVDTKPATEVYNNADDAFNAVKNGAKDYDDVVLEQFTQPGDDCTWCDEFYTKVKGALTAADVTQDQKSYFAEILSISGRMENIQTLVDAVKNAKSADEGDLYAEALELTVGKDDVTQFLGDQMGSTNETLREASVAAVTNQGSRLAAELLIKNTTERGDPDGYYSLGIGLGEFIPDEEAIPVLQSMVEKRDQFSHLGVKALLNAGMSGLKLVFDELETSKDPEADRKMMKDAVDHVNYEDGLEDYLKQKIATTKQPLVAETAKQFLDEFQNQGETEDGTSLEIGSPPVQSGK